MEHTPVVVPYVFREAKLLHNFPNYRAYYVTLFLLFDGKITYTFYHESECIENARLARECGVKVTTFEKEIIVNPTCHTDIYNAIDDYVSLSDSHKEC